MFASSRLRTAAVLFTLPLVSIATSAVGQEPTQLPGIYVESATIRAKPIRPRQPSSQPVQPAAVPEISPDEADGTQGIPLGQVGSAVSVVTTADLERQQVEYAHDALRGLPGVSVNQSGTPGNVTVVRIRGAESRHTLVLIDGVEVNSGTDGFFDFSNLSAADIEQIEVLRGPQSGLYGNSALGGVVSITTKSGHGPLALRVMTEAGTQRTGSATAQVSGGNDKAWGSVVVHGLSTDGFNISVRGDEDDGTRVKSFAARGGIALSENVRIEGTLREHNTRAEYDSTFPGDTYRGFLFVPADASFHSDTRLRVGSLQATADTFNKTWTHNVFIQGAETERHDFTTSFLETNSTNTKFGYKTTLLLETSQASPVRHFLTGLIERRTETFEQPNFSSTEFSRHRDSVVGEIRGEYFKSLFLTANVRRDDNDRFDDFTTWNASASYLLPGNMFRLHASIGTGVKYPSFGDLYGFFEQFEPEPNLRPEESTGYDVGIETRLFGGRAVLDVTYFNADLTNEIKVAFNPKTALFKPFNVAGESSRRGVEITARYLLTPQITLGAAYTYLDAEEDGKEEVRRPPHSGRLDANYVFLDGRGNLNFAAIYNGDMKDIVTDASFASVLTTLDSYWLLRVAASYKLKPGVEVFGRVENLLDEHYQEVLGFNATPGIAAFAGVSLTFGGPEGMRWAD